MGSVGGTQISCSPSLENHLVGTRALRLNRLGETIRGCLKRPCGASCPGGDITRRNEGAEGSGRSGASAGKAPTLACHVRYGGRLGEHGAGAGQSLHAY